MNKYQVTFDGVQWKVLRQDLLGNVSVMHMGATLEEALVAAAQITGVPVAIDLVPAP